MNSTIMMVLTLIKVASLVATIPVEDLVASSGIPECLILETRVLAMEILLVATTTVINKVTTKAIKETWAVVEEPTVAIGNNKSFRLRHSVSEVKFHNKEHTTFTISLDLGFCLIDFLEGEEEDLSYSPLPLEIEFLPQLRLLSLVSDLSSETD
mmetsp:Transcript_45867/g.52898  ORF Transcript_45867/g.52898 Transcript_45867/m.52898 type:complete len:154 (+) Transcript_45867:321-782(+)